MPEPSPDDTPEAPAREAFAPPFFTRYGFSRIGADELDIEPYAQLCASGALRATVVASAIDLVGGFHTREIAGSDATFTSDLSLRIPRPGVPARLRAHGERLRVGRRLISTGVRLETTDALYAYGTTTFARIPRTPRSPEDAPDPGALSTPLTIARHPLVRPLDQEVGLELVEAASGRFELPLRPVLLNPEGVMQGALVALVVECAALALADAGLACAQVVSELDLRYLAAAARGPVVSRADWIGAPSDRMIRVELRDRGHGDRRTTVALARVADGPRATV